MGTFDPTLPTSFGEYRWWILGGSVLLVLGLLGLNYSLRWLRVFRSLTQWSPEWFSKSLTTALKPAEPDSILVGAVDWTLDDYRNELRRVLTGWQRGELTVEESHDHFSRLYKTVFHRALVQNLGQVQPNGFKTQAAYDFFNLCSELAAASGYSAAQPGLVPAALRILDHHLGSMVQSKAWREFVHRRGPIEVFGVCRCNHCGRDTPWAGTSGFLFWVGFAFCGQCGDLHEYNGTDEDLGRKLAQPLDQRRNDDGLLPRCPCGGLLGRCSQEICAHCGKSGTSPRPTPVSSYEYFETHRYHSNS